MTDCSSIQGSTSSSSDVMTLTTAASSWCAMPTNSRIRVLRLVRPHHTRRMLMVTGPESNPSFGFAVRGGKEFGTGFFVSQVERSSEADLKGLRVGDQVLRLNNFRVEDAVHKEFIRFINSQDRITLKVRGVGMLPIKDKENERLSWNVVKMQSVSNTPSESSYKTVTTEQSSVCSAAGVNELRCKDISVTLDVAPRTKLGLGICKGPEWKPGIFVQFTKDKSVAREAGLRPGDQILSVNSIDFSDVLFSEAVAVMKSSNKLEMIVRTAAGCELFPGESSGYNSSASSVTGDQSPCWADVKQKRLTAVSEDQEPAMITACWNEALYAEQRRHVRHVHDENRPKEVNKTIIKLSENGTSINNTYVANPHLSSRLACQISQQDNSTLKKTSVTGASMPSSTAAIYTNLEPQSGRNKNLKIDARGNGIMIDGQEKHKRDLANLQRGTLKATSTATSMGPPKAPPPVMYGNLANYNAGSASNHQSSMKSNNSIDVTAAGSSLSSAITEELKKRKEKQRTANNAENNNNININDDNNNSSNYSQQQQQQQQRLMPSNNGTAVIAMQRQQQNQRHSHPHQHQHQSQHHPQQQQPSTSTSTSISTSSAVTSTSVPSSMSSSAVAAISPAKRAPSVRALNSNVANCSERGNTLDQHSALMDEFKRAHQRMFKNGFHERESKERQEALRCTTFMDDDTSHRTSRHFTNGKMNGSDDVDSHQHHQQQNPHQQQQHQHQSNQSSIPPPPPQFANSPPKANQMNGNSNYQTIKRANGNANPNINAVAKVLKPPSSPTPDYDNRQQTGADRSLQINSLTKMSPPKQNGIKINANTATAVGAPPSPTRRTIRLGAVTIGEYEQQRKEPNKFDFIGGGCAQNGNHGNVGSLVSNGKNFQNELQNTLSRSKLKNGTNAQQLEHKRDCPLRSGYGAENPARNQKNVFVSCEGSATVKRNGGNGNGGLTNGVGYNGILKNGNNRGGVNGAINGLNGHSTKITEKTITFGN